jgi:hypothetical protein
VNTLYHALFVINSFSNILFFQFNEFLKETGGQELSWSDWQAVGKLSLDVRGDLIETESIRKISGSVTLSDIKWSFF